MRRLGLELYDSGTRKRSTMQYAKTLEKSPFMGISPKPASRNAPGFVLPTHRSYESG